MSDSVSDSEHNRNTHRSKKREAGVKFTANDEFDVNETIDDRRCAEGTKQSLIAQAEYEVKVETSATALAETERA